MNLKHFSMSRSFTLKGHFPHFLDGMALTDISHCRRRYSNAREL